MIPNLIRATRLNIENQTFFHEPNKRPGISGFNEPGMPLQVDDGRELNLSDFIWIEPNTEVEGPST